MQHDTHIPVPNRAPLAIPNLEIHRVGEQGVRQHEILHDAQRRRVNPPRQFLMVRVLGVHFDGGDSRGSGDARDGYPPRLRGALRRVDGAVACGGGVVAGGAVGEHGVFGRVVGAVETGPEYGRLRPFVVAVVADVVDEYVGGGAGAAP